MGKWSIALMTDENVDSSLPSSEPTPEPVAEVNAQPAPASTVQPAPAPEPIIEEPVEIAPAEEEPAESFADLLRDFERSHTHKPESGARQIEGTVVSLSADQVFVDIGYKTEGVLSRSIFENNADAVKPGDTVLVSVKGRNQEGYY